MKHGNVDLKRGLRSRKQQTNIARNLVPSTPLTIGGIPELQNIDKSTCDQLDGTDVLYLLQCFDKDTVDTMRCVRLNHMCKYLYQIA